MSEAEKKYYWLKLKRDFFKRHDIRIIESMPNGKDYILFYLKLLVESLDHDGELRFSESIPYTENMLATITNTNADIVRSAIQIFTELQLMSKFDDGTLLLIQVTSLTGSETEYAEKKRIYRHQKKLQLEDNSKTKKDNVRQEIRDKSLEKELEKEKNAASAEALAIAKLLIDEHRKIDPDFATGKESTRIPAWAFDIDKINRIDGRDWKVIEDVMRWCKSDSFWCTNIMSGKKFREQFDRLYAGMTSRKPKREVPIEDLPDAPPEVLARLNGQHNGN